LLCGGICLALTLLVECQNVCPACTKYSSSKVSTVNVDLYSTLSQTTSSVLPLPVLWCWSTSQHCRTMDTSVSHDVPVYSPQHVIGRGITNAAKPPTLQDHGYRLVYHTMCLFTPPPQLLLGTYHAYRWRDVSGWVDLGCFVLRRGGLPVERRSPTQVLTGSSVE